MTLSYDFDIDRSADDALDQDGPVALFRDPETVEALLGADAEVRDYFEASGFGFETYDSGAGAGRILAEDKDGVRDVCMRLKLNFSKDALKGADWNGFDFNAFKAHIRSIKVAPATEEETTPHIEPEETAAPAKDGLTPLDRIRQRNPRVQSGEESYGINAAASQADPFGQVPHPDDSQISIAMSDHPVGDPNVGIPAAAIEGATPAPKQRGRMGATLVLFAGVILVGWAAMGAMQINGEQNAQTEETASSSGFDLASVKSMLGLGGTDPVEANEEPAAPEVSSLAERMIRSSNLSAEDANLAVESLRRLDTGKTPEAMVEDLMKQLQAEFGVTAQALNPEFLDTPPVANRVVIPAAPDAQPAD